MEETRLTVTVEEAARMIGISRGLAYQMARDKRLPTIRFGKRLVVTKRAIEHLLQVPQETATSQYVKDQVRDLVKRYALACNAMLEAKESNVIDLYQQIWSLYLTGWGNIVITVTQELLSSDELPELVRSHWRDNLPSLEGRNTIGRYFEA